MVLSLTLARVSCKICEVAGDRYGAAVAGVLGKTGGGVASVVVVAGVLVGAGTSLNIGVGVSCPKTLLVETAARKAAASAKPVFRKPGFFITALSSISNTISSCQLRGMSS